MEGAKEKKREGRKGCLYFPRKIGKLCESVNKFTFSSMKMLPGLLCLRLSTKMIL